MSVQPAVGGIERTFDYVVPPAMDGAVRVGTVVRADLGGRRVGGWVVEDRVQAPTGLALRPLTRVTGWGPTPDVVDLTSWGAWRWAGRRAAFLSTASAEGAVGTLPGPDLRPPAVPSDPGHLAGLVADACAVPIGIVRLPPAADTTALVALVAQRGPTLVVVASSHRASILAARLRRAGAGVAEVPGEWARARAGVGIVVGARGATWAPCPGLAAVVVIDAHDEGLIQEQAPTWWATTAAAERARRAGVPCVWVSPCPTLDLIAAGTVMAPSVAATRIGWAPLEIVDRRGDDPRLGLYSERLVSEVRNSDLAVCVLNRKGRARLLACGACGELARCERCGAAVAQAMGSGVPATEGPGVQASGGPVGRGAGGRGEAGPVPMLECGRCGTVRPPVCAACDSTRLRRLRVGVTRVREELEALVGRPVGEVTAATAEVPDARIIVGTEAVFHRITTAETVAFLDFDQELLAPRYRAGEEALALLARASRLVGGRRRGGRVLVQTRSPDHPALRAAVAADPALLGEEEAELRRALALPPTRAVAAVGGPGAGDFVATIPAGVDVIGPSEGRWLVRATSTGELCDALAGAKRPAGRVRVEVDPVRL